MAKISIIVPVYNTAKYLERCVDSIVAQTYTDWELLLIDDGSTDRSGDICDRYAASDPRIQAFHKPNGGISSARNLGLDHAQGEWITFADADDFTYPCWLENYDVEHNAEFDLICQGFETDRDFTDNYGVDNKTRHGIDFKGDIKEGLELLYDNNILGYPWCKAFKREIIQKNNLKFDISIKYKEDELFLFQYSVFANNIICTKKVGYFYEIPNWKAKYEKNQQERFYTNICELETIITAHFSKRNRVSRYVVEDLTSAIILLFNETHSKEYIKELRKVLKYDFWNSQMFLPTKLVILLDPTCTISKWWITLHQRIHRGKDE